MIIKRKYFFEHTYIKGFFREQASLFKRAIFSKKRNLLELEDKNYPKVTFYKVCESCGINENTDLEGVELKFKCHFCEGFCPTGALSSRNLEFNIPENTVQ